MSVPVEIKPFYKMSQQRILEELKKIILDQIEAKNSKFLSKEKPSPTQKSPYEKYQERLAFLDSSIYYVENWKYDLNYLKKLEGFFVDHSMVSRFNYFRFVVSMLYDLENLSEEIADKIRHDEKIEAMLLELKEDLLQKKKSLEMIPEHVEQLSFVVGMLDNYSEDEYIDEDLINIIFDYCQSEQYIHYADKVVNIGTLIANYNILAHEKRTSR